MFKKIKDDILQIIFPPKCVFCGDLTDNSDVCENCWKSVFWITEPCCQTCGQPFELSDRNYCKQCALNTHYFDEARSVFGYDNVTRAAILNLKNKDATYLADTFANWMCRVGKKILKNYEIIIPVPIHRNKLLRRFYNQSALLAQKIAIKSNKIYLPLALEKFVKTRPQEGLTREQRLKNIQNSFRANSKFLDQLNGKDIILIDDVMTTGATVDECAKILKKSACVNKIAILTVAKVIDTYDR